MKIGEIPQDNDPTYSGQSKLCYAVDESGQIVQAHSSGWKTEEIVKNVAWDVINKDLEITRQNIRDGHASPLTYFMKRRQMDALLLSQNMGMPTFLTRLHLRPFFFRRLSAKWLDRYAECLEIPVETLKTYQGGDDGLGQS